MTFMTFQPNPGDGIVVNGTAYTGQRSGARRSLCPSWASGIVYQLIPVDGELHEAKALKVFFLSSEFRLWCINPNIWGIIARYRVCR